MAKYQSDNQKITVNTFGYSDRNYETGTAVACKMFDNTMSVSIHLPKEGQSGDNMAFDYENGVTAYISTKDAKLLSKAGYKQLEKYEDSKGFKTISLPLKKGVIEIGEIGSLKKKLKGLVGNVQDETALCLVIYSDINESKVPQTFLVHVFNTGRLLDEYEPETGKYKICGSTAVECEYFLDALAEFAKAMTNAAAHGIKNEGKYQREKWERMVTELAVSLGLDLSKSSNGGAKKQAIAWNSSDSNTPGSIASRGTGSYKTETVEASEENIDDIINSMMN